MKSAFYLTILIGLLVFASCLSGNHKPVGESKIKTEVKRVGMVIKIDSSRIKEYRSLHADSNPGVRDLLSKYHMKNFSIFLTRLDDGSYYEFGYYEYTGNNYEADMAALDAEPRNKSWLKI
jgi:L-rhamnose mutarotase